MSVSLRSIGFSVSWKRGSSVATRAVGLAGSRSGSVPRNKASSHVSSSFATAQWD